MQFLKNNIFTSDHTIIFFVMLAVTLTILIAGIVFSIFYNKKRNEQFLTIKKVSIMATFLAIFLIFIGLNILLKSIHIELTYVIPIMVGFLMGPLEGIFFAFVADTLNSLLSGYISYYSPLSATLLPIIGLIGGLMGIIYKSKEVYPRFILMLFFQIVMVVISGLIITAGFLFPVDNKALKIPLIIFASIIFVLLEAIYFYWFFSKKKKIDLQLWTFVLITVAFARVVGLIISPLSNTIVLGGKYEVWLISMVFHSTYLIPIEAVVCYFLIKTNNYIINLT